MGEPQQTIAVAGSTPFAFVLAGLLAADHGRKVFVIAGPPSPHGVPPPPSLSVAPLTRPETLQLAAANAPDIMRRIAKVAPAAFDRTDLTVHATTPYHATALSHFRHLGAGLGLAVERLPSSEDGLSLRVRDVTRLSPTPFLAHVRQWASRIGLEWVEDRASLSIRRSGAARLGSDDIDQLVLADDEAIFEHLDPNLCQAIGFGVARTAFLAERGHGLTDVDLRLPDGTLLSPCRDGTLLAYADSGDGLADARVAASLPEAADTRQAAVRHYRQLRTHDGGPVVGMPKGSRIYLSVGLGMLDIALAPVIARHICGLGHGLEAEWCGLRTPGRSMAGSLVADIGDGEAA
ncbi:hypothetical protein [Pelagibacterium limicola]|uniref:hypothetical protein n=1 Tax=Pelagibacterium limicola TaxID=2791022 RepID=UPI0018AF9CCA|nr:hypothetical protein [Pelagibacterium limicola]